MAEKFYLNLFARLVNPAGRLETARELAGKLGAKDLIFFVPDQEVGALLPAPGFPQTLPVGKVWRALLKRTSEDKEGRGEGEVYLFDNSGPTPAWGIKGEDGSVLVLLGGKPNLKALKEITFLFPLLSATFRGELAAIAAKSQAKIAQESAAASKVLVDVLEKTRKELQLSVAQRDNFLSIASHELRTPVSAIMGFSQHLNQRARQNDGKLSPRDFKALDIIFKQTKRLEKLISELLDLSRLQGEGLALENRPLDLAKLLRGLVEEITPLVEKHSIKLNLPAYPVMIAGDSFRLEQAFLNLINNSIKYSPNNYTITINVGRKANKAFCSIDDKGIGISREALPLIFERFFRADNGRAEIAGGLGIGLFLVKEIVTLHGGEVKVESEIGKGATFTVAFPFLSANQVKATSGA